MSGGVDFVLTTDELRVVTRFALASAEEVLEIFERQSPGDTRPSAAVGAARLFAEGAPRGRLQRVASTEAHRAAREVADKAAGHAARAAGDAAASAYLHPLAQATQVGHILRASANAARALELATDDPEAGQAAIERARARANPVLSDILRRYPLAPAGRTPTAHLMTALDASLRRQP